MVMHHGGQGEPLSPVILLVPIVFTRKVIVKHCNYFLWIFTIAMVLYDYHYHK